MADAVYRGTVQGGTVVLAEGVDLPDGTDVVVMPADAPKGSPAAVLAAMAAPPHLEEGDTAELMRLIDEGKRPVDYSNPLDRDRRRRGE